MNAPTDIAERVVKTSRHTTSYLRCGPDDATPLIFLHGWPELSSSWRHQLPVFGGLGFFTVAPDMRGYGASSVYSRHEEYALELIVADMIELLDSLGAERAIWVGHDWGSPVVWGIAQEHPDRCHGIASLCVPYVPSGWIAEHIIDLANRTVYPEDEYPAAQWDYQLFYRESFAAATAAFEKDVRATVKLLFRSGEPDARGKPWATALVRKNGGIFGPGNGAPEVPRDPAVLTQADEDHYTAALERNGFFGPNSWYMNSEANAAYAARLKDAWRLSMPVLFVHGAHDHVCDTIDSPLAEPMRANCDNLTEATVQSGHWMAQEKPGELNAILARWLSMSLNTAWPGA